MELMLDSANLEEIREIKEAGFLEGLTTNPVLINRAIKELNYNGNFITYAQRILELTGNNPTFFQVISYSKKDLVKEAENIYKKLGSKRNVYIKVPISTAKNPEEVNYEGIRAIRELKDKGIPTLATAIVTPVQAFLASKSGADYTVLVLRNYDNIIAEKLDIKDFSQEAYLDKEAVLNGLREKGLDANIFLSSMDTLDRTSRIFENQNLESKLIIAGIRNQVQVSEILEKKGISAMSLPYNVFNSILNQEGTRKFVEQTYSGASDRYKDFVKNE